MEGSGAEFIFFYMGFVLYVGLAVGVNSLYRADEEFDQLSDARKARCVLVTIFWPIAAIVTAIYGIWWLISRALGFKNNGN